MKILFPTQAGFEQAHPPNLLFIFHTSGTEQTPSVNKHAQSVIEPLEVTCTIESSLPLMKE